MTLNVPHRVRALLYIITAVGTPVVTYLYAKEAIGELELALWSAEVTVVSLMARLNTVPTHNEDF